MEKEEETDNGKCKEVEKKEVKTVRLQIPVSVKKTNNIKVN